MTSCVTRRLVDLGWKVGRDMNCRGHRLQSCKVEAALLWRYGPSNLDMPVIGLTFCKTNITRMIKLRWDKSFCWIQPFVFPQPKKCIVELRGVVYPRQELTPPLLPAGSFSPEGYSQRVWKTPGQPSKWDRRMLIFCLFERIFSVFSLILVSRMGFGTTNSVFRGTCRGRKVPSACPAGTCSMFRCTVHIYRNLLVIFHYIFRGILAACSQRVFGGAYSALSGVEVLRLVSGERHLISDVIATGFRGCLWQFF